MVEAVNKWVWVIRDKPETEKAGLVLLKSATEKPHTGLVISIGSMVEDKRIKAAKGKRAVFHKTVGNELTYKEVTYLIIHEEQILGIE